MSTIDTLSQFGSNFQSKSISVMLTDKQFLDQAYDIVDSKHFDSQFHAWIVDTIIWYFMEYRDIPTMEVFKTQLDKIENNQLLRDGVRAALKDVYVNTRSSDLPFIKDEYLTFCRNQAIKNAILSSTDKLKVGDYDGIKALIDKAMNAGQERNYGHDWKNDLAKRLENIARNTVSTGWPVIDEIMDGGLASGELGVIVAPPGIGKSWGLNSLGKHALQNGKKVVHYTFELNDKYVGLRYDTMFTGIETRELKNNLDLIKKVVNQVTGELIIKIYPTKSCSTNALRAHIERLKMSGFNPDVVLVDYADLMLPTGKADSRWQELGIVYEDLRCMAGELEIPVWTASQSQRSSMNDDVIEAHKIAESFNKVMTADFILSISRKLVDKVANTGRIHIIKNRFGPDGMTFPALCEFTYGKFEIYDDNSSEGIRIKQQMQEGDNVLKTLMHKKLIDLTPKSREDSDDLF